VVPTGDRDHRCSRPAKPSPERSLPSAWEDDFELNSEEPFLGGGAFAKISRVVERSSGQAFAMKVMSRPNFAIRGIEAQVDAEIEAMRRCAEAGSCRHVLRFCDVAEERDHVYIRLELCVCDLLRFATCQTTGRLTEQDGRHWAGQLLSGLGDLHDLGIVHRDIKPENLLCTGDGTLKIADFGWCAELCSAPSSLAGTLQYMAPEVLLCHSAQTEAVDVWSAGVTILQLLTGRQLLTTYLGPGATGMTITGPHQATRVKTLRLLTEIHERCPLHEDVRPPYLSRVSWDFLRAVVVPEVADRATVPEALGHPWLMDKEEFLGDVVEEAERAGGTIERTLSSSTNSASMPALNVPTPPLAEPAGKRPPREREPAKSQPPAPVRATLGRRSEANLQQQRPRLPSQEPVSPRAGATAALPRAASPPALASRHGEPRAPRVSLMGGPRFGSPGPQERRRAVPEAAQAPVAQPSAPAAALAVRTRAAGDQEQGQEGNSGGPRLRPCERNDGRGIGNRSSRRTSFPLTKASVAFHEVREASDEVAEPDAGASGAAGAATAGATGGTGGPQAAAWPVRNRRLTLPASSPPPKPRGSLPASAAGASTLRVYKGDVLSRSSPPDCSKTTTPGVPPTATPISAAHGVAGYAGRSENEPADANADPATVAAPRGDAKAVGDPVLRRTVLVCPWPTVAFSPGPVQVVAAAVPQRGGHVAPLPSPSADRCRLSPRQRASPPPCTARPPLTAAAATATATATATVALQQASMPTTPGAGPERCRDLAPMRPQRVGGIATLTC